ncbi:beta-galactosidase-like [Rhododendron vialii]|uniref:beta-galactosidase-like n=1 Tax=Rhododendron vialii TaxID=182163 RepID=UPI00265DF5DA|nr:beta-galactosidase-like [Rhododendron vialii]
MVTKLTENQAESEPVALRWTWRPETTNDTVQLGKVYILLINGVNIKEDDPLWSDDMSIRVNGTGHMLHAYVNGKYIGSHWATSGIFNYVFEKKEKLNPGKNQITLLSATVGFQNYGPKFDMIESGLPGPVELIGRKGDESVIKDLSSHKWTYEVGLHGLDNKVYSLDSRYPSKWQAENLPINRMMTWYKTTFKAPLGTDPVALDLQGMGKGEAWVNGQNIGRYWPSYLAEEDGCSTEPCDYRGKNDSSKCVSNCRQPTQRCFRRIRRQPMTHRLLTSKLTRPGLFVEMPMRTKIWNCHAKVAPFLLLVLQVLVTRKELVVHSIKTVVKEGTALWTLCESAVGFVPEMPKGEIVRYFGTFRGCPKPPLVSLLYRLHLIVMGRIIRGSVSLNAPSIICAKLTATESSPLCER